MTKELLTDGRTRRTDQRTNGHKASYRDARTHYKGKSIITRQKDNIVLPEIKSLLHLGSPLGFAGGENRVTGNESYKS